MNKELKLLIELCDSLDASVISYKITHDMDSDKERHVAIVYFDDKTLFASTLVFDNEKNCWK